jgi:hypothetical protein
VDVGGDAHPAAGDAQAQAAVLAAGGGDFEDEGDTEPDVERDPDALPEPDEPDDAVLLVEE